MAGTTGTVDRTESLRRSGNRPGAATAVRVLSPVALPDGLTERDGGVLALMADGLANAEIAGRLFVSEATVRTHVDRTFAKTTFAKTNSRDRAQATAYAHRRGLAP